MGNPLPVVQAGDLQPSGMRRYSVKVRPPTVEEREILFYWERADNIDGYVCSRVIHLSEKGWNLKDIAQALGIDPEKARQIILDFNLGGIPAIAPKP